MLLVKETNHKNQESEQEDLSKVCSYTNQDFPEDVSTMITSYKRKYDDSYGNLSTK